MPQATKLLARIMPNAVALTPPGAEPALSGWKKMLEGDTATLRERENRLTLRKMLAKCAVHPSCLCAVSDPPRLRHSLRECENRITLRTTRAKCMPRLL